MAFVQFSHVSLAFGERNILKNVSVHLQTGTKAALTGANGAGKSTLIKVMAGLITPDSGSVAIEKNTRIAYLPQSGLTHSGTTLIEECDRAFAFGYELQEQIDELGEKLQTNPPNTESLVLQQSALIAKLEESLWHHRRAQAESVLEGLGFLQSDFNRRTEEFSGGWQMRIALAKALMQNPDVLLLDEPTNYLDLEARTWLEQFLLGYKGAFLLVSHDRYFLDTTITEVFELFDGNLKRYPGNFTHYEQVRKVELKTLVAAYEQQQKEIRHLEDFIRRFGSKATKAAQAQERQKQLEKIVRIEIPEQLKKIHFSFPPAPHAGRLVLRLNDIAKSYDGTKNVIGGVNIVLENGERLVVAGRNGAGKSTLLRIIAGVDLNFSGEAVFGAGVTAGYFSQDSAEKISSSVSVLDYVESRAPLALIPKIRDMLGAFLFRGDDVFKSLDVLSGGEKSRIALLSLLLCENNLLILDEPTNHLDMHSKDVLLDALKSFGGTVIFVSHDRGFIESLATKVLEVKDGKAREFPGGYAYYLERLEAERSGKVAYSSFGTGNAEKQTTTEQDMQKTPKTAGKVSWEENKRVQAEKRRAEKEVSRIEEAIALCEAQKREAEGQLALPDVYSDGEKAQKTQKEISALTARLDELNTEWEAAMEKVLSFEE